MHDETPIAVDRNPAQTVQSVVRLFGFRIRGNAVYIFFGGLAGGVLLSLIAYQFSIILAAITFIALPTASVLFIKVFIINRLRGYFSFWLDQLLTGPYLRKPVEKRRVTHETA